MLPYSPCIGVNFLQKTIFSFFLVIATVPALQPLLLLQQQFGNPWIMSESCCCYNGKEQREQEQTSAQDVQDLFPGQKDHTGDAAALAGNRRQWQLHRKGCSCILNQRTKVQIQLLSCAVLCPPQADLT